MGEFSLNVLGGVDYVINMSNFTVAFGLEVVSVSLSDFADSIWWTQVERDLVQKDGFQHKVVDG